MPSPLFSVRSGVQMALVYWAAVVIAVATSGGASPYQRRPHQLANYRDLQNALDKRVHDGMSVLCTSEKKALGETQTLRAGCTKA